MEKQDRQLNGHSEQDAVLLMWEWFQRAAPLLDELRDFKNVVVGALVVLVALGLVNTVVQAVSLIGAK